MERFLPDPLQTAEDQKRARGYRENKARREHKRKIAAEMRESIDPSDSWSSTPASVTRAFLDSLGLEFIVTHVHGSDPCYPSLSSEKREELIARVSQLSMRTNQMNSTQLRLPSPESVKSWLKMDFDRRRVSRFISTVSVSDNFGEYGMVCQGLVSVAWRDGNIVESSSNDVTVTLDCMNMSCRVLGRGVEKILLGGIAKEVERLVHCVSKNAERGVNIRVPIVETKRNDPIRNFFSGLIAELEGSR
eukprot:5258452-Amphidinium_carterae.1